MTPRISVLSLSSRLGTLLVALGVATSCLGGQSTDEDGNCIEARAVLASDDEASKELGIVPSDVLEWVLASRETTAEWHQLPDGITSSVAPGATSLDVTIRRGQGDSVELSGGCGDTRLSIPAVVDIQSADGALDESLSGAITLTRPDFALFEAELDFDRVIGSLRIESEQAGLRFVQPTLMAAITPRGSAGWLTAILERRTSDSVSALPSEPLLDWPDGFVCLPREVQLSLDQTQANTWPSLVEAATAQPWMGTWQDGTNTDVEVSVTLAGALCETQSRDEYAPAFLRIKTRDGRVEIQLSTFAWQEGTELALALAEGRSFGGAPDEFKRQYGDFGLELDGYDYVQLEAELSTSAESGSGRLAVIGYASERSEPCTADSCPSSGPAARKLLLELTLQRP